MDDPITKFTRRIDDLIEKNRKATTRLMAGLRRLAILIQKTGNDSDQNQKKNIVKKSGETNSVYSKIGTKQKI
jgi:hypothetical protein